MPHRSHPIPDLDTQAPVARAILNERLIPTNYATVVDETWDRLAWASPRKPGHGFDNIGASREKFRQALRNNRRGFGYLGAGDAALMFLVEWFDRDGRLVNVQEAPIVIPTTDAILARSNRESEWRLPHIKNKFGRSADVHASTVLRGLNIQMAVEAYLVERWPSHIFPPTNADDAAYGAHDDLRILRDGKLDLVDVAGRNAYGRCAGKFGGYGGVDKRADYHILADVNRDAQGKIASISVVGYCYPKDFARGIDVVEAMDFRRIMVGLNCEVAGYDRAKFVAAIGITPTHRTRKFVESGGTPPTATRNRRKKNPAQRSLL